MLSIESSTTAAMTDKASTGLSAPNCRSSFRESGERRPCKGSTIKGVGLRSYEFIKGSGFQPCQVGKWATRFSPHGTSRQGDNKQGKADEGPTNQGAAGSPDARLLPPH